MEALAGHAAEIVVGAMGGHFHRRASSSMAAEPPAPDPRVPVEREVRYTFPVTEIVPGITADPARAFGKPVIAGTRVPAATVLGLLAAGRPEAEILAEYDLTTEQLRAVFRYAAWLASQQSLRAS
jgi:uncharacterized protein (DUF433 family)